MGDQTDDLTMRMRTRGARASAREIDRPTKAVGRYTKATGKANVRTRIFTRGLGSLTGQMRHGVKHVGAFVAGIAAFEGLHAAAETTEAFAHSTIGLHKAFGLTIEDASRWAAIAKTRGVAPNALTMAFTKNSRAVEAASTDWKTNGKVLRSIGITQKDVAAGRKDFQGLLMKESDALANVHSGTKRAAVGQQLFGRGFLKLRPLLLGGSKNFNTAAAMADKYGVTLHGKTIKSVEDMIQAQREAAMASLGLQLTLGRTLTPAITWITEKFSLLVDKIRNGDGDWKRFRERVSDAAKWVGNLIQKFREGDPQVRNIAKAIAITVAALWTLNVLIKVVGWIRALSGAMAFLAANPIILAIAAIVAISAALYILYHRSQTARDIMDKLWMVLKHVPVIEVIRHLGTIIDFVKTMPGAISSAATGMWDGLKSGLVSVINWIIDRLNDLIGPIGGLLGHFGIHVGTIGHVGDTSMVDANTRAGAGYTGTGAPTPRGGGGGGSGATAQPSRTPGGFGRGDVTANVHIDGKRVGTATARADKRRRSTK